MAALAPTPNDCSFNGPLNRDTVRTERFVKQQSLVANLPADSVLLLVERFLIGPGDMAMVEFGHCPLLMSNRPILRMQTLRLSPGYLALPTLGIDPSVLVL